MIEVSTKKLRMPVIYKGRACEKEKYDKKPREETVWKVIRNVIERSDPANTLAERLSLNLRLQHQQKPHPQPEPGLHQPPR